MLNSNTYNHLTVGKQMSAGLFKNSYQQTIYLQITYMQYIYVLIGLSIK